MRSDLAAQLDQSRATIFFSTQPPSVFLWRRYFERGLLTAPLWERHPRFLNEQQFIKEVQVLPDVAKALITFQVAQDLSVRQVQAICSQNMLSTGQHGRCRDGWEFNETAAGTNARMNCHEIIGRNDEHQVGAIDLIHSVPELVRSALEVVELVEKQETLGISEQFGKVARLLEIGQQVRLVQQSGEIGLDVSVRSTNGFCQQIRCRALCRATRAEKDHM